MDRVAQHRPARSRRHGAGGMRGGLAVLWLLAGWTSAEAGEVLALDVAHEDDRYTVFAEAIIHAPIGAVRATLTDYAHLDRLNPSILRSDLLPSPGAGVTRVRTLIEACVLIFCRHFTRIEDVRMLDADRLEAELVADGSDFRAGQSDWRLVDVGPDTRLTYRASMTPAFGVPPLLGPVMIRRALQRELRTMLDNLEHLARTPAARSAE